jgi:hypothetical protein
MKQYPDHIEYYRRMLEEGRKAYASLTLAEKRAIAARLRDAMEKLAPVRAANKAKRAAGLIKIRIKTA